jgi:hypothetical protein
MDQENLIPLEHIPFAQPRSGTSGEAIYLGLWLEYLAARPDKLDRILHATNRPTTQRDASICASFMVYMGCASGRSFVETAKRYVERGMVKHDAFLSAWASANERVAGVNHGLRTIEFMLAPTHPIKSSPTGDQVDWEQVPTITLDDIDVVEAMVAWWASYDGHEMRAIAEPMIEAANRKLLSKIFKPDQPEKGCTA